MDKILLVQTRTIRIFCIEWGDSNIFNYFSRIFSICNDVSPIGVVDVIEAQMKSSVANWGSYPKMVHTRYKKKGISAIP